ncbi:hypothetical protein PLESTM_001187100 [Pleodorina starrii]|nr:hypothetical protein PLESTM_001187100 [Pleodorina starrii]
MPSFLLQGGRFSRGPAVLLPGHAGEQCGHRISRLSWPLRAVNNQHSHIDDELRLMQAQLVLQQPQTSHKHASHKHHVFHDTEQHPYQRQSHRHVHHEGHHEGEGAFGGSAIADNGELASAVELSYQYSSNIVNYRTETPPLQRTVIHARVADYQHPSVLARDLLFSLLGGGKLLLELPDEPAAVSNLMTALGRAAAKLRSVGLATALDPVYDPAAIMSGGTCSSNNNSAAHAHAVPGHANNHSHHNGGGGSGAGSPSSSQDVVVGAASARRSHDCNGTYVLCARAVPMPPAADAGYTVGNSMGQEVLRVGPSIGVHSLLPALLRAILRDGLCTLRACWFDEELAADTWSDDEDDEHHAAPAAAATNGGGEGCEELDGGCDAGGLWSSGRSGSPGSAPAPVPAAAALSADAHAPTTPAGSLVRVPCVLRAIFKLDRQLRGLDLGGVVVLPHTFTRSCRDSNTQVLYLDVVIA